MQTEIKIKNGLPTPNPTDQDFFLEIYFLCFYIFFAINKCVMNRSKKLCNYF